MVGWFDKVILCLLLWFGLDLLVCFDWVRTEGSVMMRVIHAFEKYDRVVVFVIGVAGQECDQILVNLLRDELEKYAHREKLL